MDTSEAKEKAQIILDYFRDLPQENIMQASIRIEGDHRVGCFGTHVAVALDIKADPDKEVWYFSDGARALEDIVSAMGDQEGSSILSRHSSHQFPNLEILFSKHGIDLAFGIRPWARRPYDVLSDIFHDIGLIDNEQQDLQVGPL